MTARKQPPPLEIEQPPASPDELRHVFASLRTSVSRCYEEALVDDQARVEYRDEAKRIATLARELLTPPADGDSSGYVLLTDVLSGTTLDEIIRLSIADYRQFQESLEDAQRLIDTQLAERAARELPSIISALPPSPPPAAPRPVQQSNVGFYVGLAALAVAIVVAVVVVPRIVDQVRRNQADSSGGPDSDPLSALIPPEHAPATKEDVVIVDRKGTEEPPAVTPIPTFDDKKAPSPAAPEPTKGPETPVVETPQPRYRSRWKPAPDGWITVFNGRDLDGLLGDATQWTVPENNVLQGAFPGGATGIGVAEAAWTNFQIRFEVMLGRAGSFAVRQDGLAVSLTDKTVFASVRGSSEPVASVAKGLTRRKWYPVVVDLNGRDLTVTVNGSKALSSASRPEARGNPLLEVIDGAVRFRNVAIRLHESDPDYAAVVLGEGYANKPEAPIVGPPEPIPTQPTGLPLGDHTLFDGSTLKGWARSGDSTVMSGSMLFRAPARQLSTALNGNIEWRDVVFQAEGRLTRAGRMPKDGEYFLIIFRGQDDSNFLCIRFALEGIYEIGYYRNGRWTETGRARFGLGSDFNKWHSIQIKVQGKALDIVIDGNSTGPTLPIAYWGKGFVGVGVTGGEAIFRNVRVRALR